MKIIIKKCSEFEPSIHGLVLKRFLNEKAQFVVIINANDTLYRRILTVFHELNHIIMGDFRATTKLEQEEMRNHKTSYAVTYLALLSFTHPTNVGILAFRIITLCIQ